MGGVTFLSQLGGSLLAVVYALLNGFVIYAIIRKVFGIRLTAEQEFSGPDLAIHSINAYPEERV